jgi:hypothetical protein
VNLATHAEVNNSTELLQLFVALKLTCSGKIKAKNKALQQIRSSLGIKSRTTFNKRLTALKQLNWIGFNDVSGYYFVRSYERVCSDLGLTSRRRVNFQTSQFPHFRLFCFAAIVCQKIKALEFAMKKGKDQFVVVPKYLAGTNPPRANEIPQYPCISLAYMAKLTRNSISRCSELKNEAEKAKLLITKEKLIPVDIFSCIPYLRQGLQEKFPGSFGRFRIRKIKYGKEAGKFRLLEQMPDEIIPLLRFRRDKF